MRVKYSLHTKHIKMGGVRVLYFTRLASYRQQMGLKQADLAKELGISRMTLSAIETEKYEPSLRLAVSCARYFGVPIENLFVYRLEK